MLALEDPMQTGPAAAASAYRPSSVSVSQQHQSSSSSRGDRDRKRASHAPTSSHTANHSENTFLPVRDVYSHPAAVAFQAAHPRRTIPRFGPYLLLQTIGEGEFGKVKLGLHSEYGEEVAVKLIRRGSVDNTVRMGKVEREIDVLKLLRHPNIVRLYDVIETDKYIGIVLEYASGGELFDHILAHRCLKEKDACRLFAQLISGVSYIHAKKIVHRDLKLENLLLDRNRNVIISDFGFANRFEHRADDLMQTSCGSPCYAAPELVISEGLYVGSAVDIWSCGVILYAMLAGYLPFDDDPANPDGDNINLLYKYIINTPLTFPDYISEEARDLLSKMLVPDPTRRADLRTIMEHRWLRAYRHFFDRSVDECEQDAILQHQAKREEYARKLRLKTQPAEEDPVAAHHREHREQRRHRERGERAALADITAPPASFATSAAIMSDSALTQYGNQSMDVDSSGNPRRRAQAASAIVMPTERKRDRSQPPGEENRHIDADPPPAAQIVPLPDDSSPVREKKKRSKQADRHTIQVEYDDPENASTSRPPMPTAVQDIFSALPSHDQPVLDQPAPPQHQRQRLGSTPPVAMSHVFQAGPPKQDAGAVQQQSSPPKALPPPPPVPPIPAVSPPAANLPPQRSASVRTTNGKSSRSRVSLDKLGLGRVFGSNSTTVQQPPPPPTPVEYATPQNEVPSRAESVSTRQATEDEASVQENDTTVTGGDSGFAKMKRRTLNLVVGSGKTERKSSSRQSKQVEKDSKPPASAVVAPSNTNGTAYNVLPPVAVVVPEPTGNAASTSKAKKVMDWFRSRSVNRGRPDGAADASVAPPMASTQQRPLAPALVITTPPTHAVYDQPLSVTPLTADPMQTPITPSLTTRLASAILPPSFASSGRSMSSPSVAAQTPSPGGAAGGPVNPILALRVHHGAVDQGTVTTGNPTEVFAHVRRVLQGMGVELQKESEYKYRCVRPKKKKTASITGGTISSPPQQLSTSASKEAGVAAYTMVGSASMNGIDKRGLPHPSGMFRGLLTRRASSHVSDADEDNTIVRSPTGPQALPTDLETVYGDRALDLMDEVRFSVELTRIDRLDDTLSLDIRRLKGNLRSYKFVYDTLRERCAFKE